MSIHFRLCSRLLQLRRSSAFSIQRWHSSSAPNIVFEQLQNRSLLKLSGPDTDRFLQGVISNDMEVLKLSDVEKPCMYSMVLNTIGRVLYDCLIYRLGEDTYLLEHDLAAINYLKTHLQMYRLRKAVQIEPVDYSVWAAYSWAEDVLDIKPICFKELLNMFEDKEGALAVEDPRIQELGCRVIIHKGNATETQLKDRALANTNKEASYSLLRYILGIGEGVIDHPPGSCLPFETNIDILRGVSFNKGCYIGQETTARIQFTGVVRKRLMPVTLVPELETYPVFDAECGIVNDKGQKIGKLRNNIGKRGLAVLNVVEAMKSKALMLKGYDYELIPSRPPWWPLETIAN